MNLLDWVFDCICLCLLRDIESCPGLEVKWREGGSEGLLSLIYFSFFFFAALSARIAFNPNNWLFAGLSDSSDI